MGDCWDSYGRGELTMKPVSSQRTFASVHNAEGKPYLLVRMGSDSIRHELTPVKALKLASDLMAGASRLIK